jgi:hypothetical protein
MNRLSKTLIVLSLSTAANAALALDPGFPSSPGEDTPLSAEFPNLRTYADAHRVDGGDSRNAVFPSDGAEQVSLSSVFPDLRTYADTHQNPAVLSNTAAYPSSVNEEPSLADEGLVRGVRASASEAARGPTR